MKRCKMILYIKTTYLVNICNRFGPLSMVSMNQVIFSQRLW